MNKLRNGQFLKYLGFHENDFNAKLCYAGWADFHVNRKLATLKINVVFMMMIVMLAECTSVLFL